MTSVSAAPSPSTSLVELRGGTVLRSGRAILDSINWKIQEGEHWVILGPNGAGKTTIARLLAGRERLDSGSMELLGSDLNEHAPEEIASRVGFASVDVGQRLLGAERVLDAVRTAAWGQTIRFQEEYEDDDTGRAQDLLEALGIGSLAQRTMGTLSEGERRRVLLARSLMADPELLILDEPTAGLDLGGRETLLRALREIMSSPVSPAVILITHELEVIAPEFTHALLLGDGRAVAIGPIGSVLNDSNLSAAFGLDLRVEKRDGRWWATAAS